MLWKLTFVILLSLVVFDPQTPQLKNPSERQSGSLPQELTETETQTILKEGNPKPRVGATLKVSDARLASALKLVRESQYKPAVQDVNAYAELMVYADAYHPQAP